MDVSDRAVMSAVHGFCTLQRRQLGVGELLYLQKYVFFASSAVLMSSPNDATRLPLLGLILTSLITGVSLAKLATALAPDSSSLEFE